MNIGFDAKRAYHNQTGLGHYSRTLIHSLARYYPENQYFLFNPAPSNLFHFNEPGVSEIRPRRFFPKLFPSAWRSSWVKTDLRQRHIDLYHGLSHEVPIGISQTGIKSVVSIHDLIHERFPGQYNPVDVQIYRKKFQYACHHADTIIAISEQTKDDIIRFYKISADKIVVVYQSCNPAFGEETSDEKREAIRSKYGLPPEFFLYVGSIIERKNLMNICKAVFMLRNELEIPLIVIGNGGSYKQKVKDFVKQNGLEKKIIFLSEQPSAKASQTFQNAEDLPSIYRCAAAMIYPSFFEGFGIPVLEALWSSLPVITSNVSCLPEVAGNAAFYVNPHSAEEIALGMKTIYNEKGFANDLRQKGWLQAQKFTTRGAADAMMNVYQTTLGA